MQMVYGRDAILNIKHSVDWKRVKERKQQIIHKNNSRENKHRAKHVYAIGQKILILTNRNKSKFDPEYEGPYEVTKVNNNGTVKYTNGTITDVINIRNIHPFKE